MHTSWTTQAEEEEVFLPSPHIAENFKREVVFSLSLSQKNHWGCLRKTSQMVYNRMLHSFRPASPTLVAASTHTLTMMKAFCPLWNLVKRRRNYELENSWRINYHDSNTEEG